MAIETCGDCGNKIASSARSCPRCGAYHWTNGRIIFAILILAFFGLFIRGMFQ